MAGYTPTYIKGMETGLVQNRENFILPNDAYPVLENAYVWRERIKRKRGTLGLGRLARIYSGGMNVNAGSANIFSTFMISPPASIIPGTFVFGYDSTHYDDLGNGVLKAQIGPRVGTINYLTGDVTVPAAGVAGGTIGSVYIATNQPVMGLCNQELANTVTTNTIAFDQTYAYQFDYTLNMWSEFLPGTTWTGNDYNFFYSTNYWVDSANNKIFWVTNYSGPNQDPIRFTNGKVGATWYDFTPPIDNSGNLLVQCLCILPFRGRLVTFNTFEGASINSCAPYTNRIRWSAIGNPFTQAYGGSPPVQPIIIDYNEDAWRDDKRGQGGFLDIPTTESITAVGAVRDNIVVYCERSTWQLRYTGRSIAPFQIERVNAELGSGSTFSAVQFDTSLVGIGDKGIVECDSYQSKRIDIKIPDLVFLFNNANEGQSRIFGIRNFTQRLAYWIYPYSPDDQQSGTVNKYPNKRLVYNYENDSWAIFDDFFTALGNFQYQNPQTWQTIGGTWSENNSTWISAPADLPLIIGGNQQGYIFVLDNKVTNDPSLYITNITGNNTTPTVVTSPNHNLLTGQVVQINIIGSSAFSNLNGVSFSIVRVDSNNFQLWLYNPSSGQFNTPQLDSSSLVYIGNGQVTVVDNFSIKSKKFNYLEDAQNIQFGFLDILTDNTSSGAFTLNVYLDYNDSEPVNNGSESQDPFFNTIVPTSTTSPVGSSKNWNRIFCAVRGAFITLEYTLSNAQMVGVEQQSDVQIDAQVLWMRKAGRYLIPGGY